MTETIVTLIEQRLAHDEKYAEKLTKVTMTIKVADISVMTLEITRLQDVMWHKHMCVCVCV